MRSALFGVVAVVVASTVTGCGTIFGSDKSVVLHVPEIIAPATIAAGTPLSVALTVESGGCTSFDHIEKQRNESGASITAWGRDGGGKNVSCPSIMRYDKVSVRFDPPFASTFVITVNQGELPPRIVTVRVE